MGRILIVDDDDDARTMLGKLLGVAGHETVFAANGWEALLTLDNSQVDLVLLDLMMPGMDGPTFLRIMRQSRRNQNLPVVVVTALDYGSAEAALGPLGVERFLKKNEELFKKLLSVVDTVLGDAGGDVSPAQTPSADPAPK